MSAPPVRVGVAVLIQKGSTILVGKRKGSHGAGTIALPGGHLEFGESFQECALRETAEETGIVLPSVQFCHAVNTVFDAEKHYVTIFVCASVPEGTEAQLLEPNKCEGWEWVPTGLIPQPRFPPLEDLLAERPDLSLLISATLNRS